MIYDFPKNTKLVLLSCCAPCSAGAIRQLADIKSPSPAKGCPARGGVVDKGKTQTTTTPSAFGIHPFAGEGDFDFVVLFYNPNIYPEIEHIKRLDEQIRLCEELGVKYFAPEYDHKKWLDDIAGANENSPETYPERGDRCAACFRHRFRFAQKFAIENGYNAIASVLGVSKHKSQEQVDACANDEITKLQNYKIIYLPIKWDESLRIAENKKHDFYRQNYCGCEFSLLKSQK